LKKDIIIITGIKYFSLEICSSIHRKETGMVKEEYEGNILFICYKYFDNYMPMDYN
jgi:hypothetical protein